MCGLGARRALPRARIGLLGLVGVLAVVTLPASGCSVGGRPAAAASTSTGPVQPAPGSEQQVDPAASPGGTSPRGQGGRASRTLRRPDGSLRVEDLENGFTVDLPRGFTRVASKAALDTTARTGSTRLRAALAATAPDTPRLSGPLLVVDPARGLAVTLLTTPAGGTGIDLDGADLTGQADAIRDQLQNALGVRVTMTTIQVDGEPALRGQAEVRAGGLGVRLTQVYAVHGNRFYTATFGEGGTRDPAVVARILASLHYLA
jgi:hypothetical protein